MNVKGWVDGIKMGHQDDGSRFRGRPDPDDLGERY